MAGFVFPCPLRRSLWAASTVVREPETCPSRIIRFPKESGPEAWPYLGAGRHLAPGCLVGPFVQNAAALSAIWWLLLGARASRALWHRLPSSPDRSYCILARQSSWTRAFRKSTLERQVDSRPGPRIPSR